MIREYTAAIVRYACLALEAGRRAPIYWGFQFARENFPPSSFISALDYLFEGLGEVPFCIADAAVLPSDCVFVAGGGRGCISARVAALQVGAVEGSVGLGRWYSREAFWSAAPDRATNPGAWKVYCCTKIGGVWYDFN